MDELEIKAFVNDFLSSGDIPTSLSYENEEGFCEARNLSSADILECEEEIFFELMKQTRGLPNCDIYDNVKEYFEQLKGVECLKN